MTKANTPNPFDGLHLDADEQELETVLDSGRFEEAAEPAFTKDALADAAKHYRQLHTSKPVTLRINQLDLIKIKAKAQRSNIPYQTLVGAVLHDFAEGKRDLTIK